MWWKVVRAQNFFVWCMRDGVQRGQSIEPLFCIEAADVPQRDSFAPDYLQLVLLFDVVCGTQKSARRLRVGQSIISMKLAITDLLPLPNSSNKIPKLGFGVYQSSPFQCIQSCLTALKAGYRHIDTAQFYANEAEVGKAVQDSGIKRSDVFLTTKILSASGSVQKSYEKCLASVERIDPGKDGYVDLFLIHSPNSGKEKRKEMWLAVERLYGEGKVKSIGVSNYGAGHIEEMKAYAKVWPPQVNQIEVCRIVSHLYGIGTAYTTFHSCILGVSRRQ
jgi:Aldo/keto reductase family